MKVWNFTVALANADNDPALLKVLLEIWLKQCPQFIQVIDDIIVRREVTSVRKVTHMLKGSLQVLGAEMALERTSRAEVLATTGDADSTMNELKGTVAALNELQTSVQEWYDNNTTPEVEPLASPSGAASAPSSGLSS